MAGAQRPSGERLLVDCGCLNLAKASVTPDLAGRYAVRATRCWSSCSCAARPSPGPALAERFPQFDADGGWLDVDAGFADVAAVTGCCATALRARGVQGGTRTRGAARYHPVRRHLDGADRAPGRSSRTSWSSPPGWAPTSVLGLLPGCSVRFPLRPDRPSQSKYFIPGPCGPAICSPRRRCRSSPTWTSGSTAIRSTKGRRRGEDRLLQPADVARAPSRISSVEDFVAECMPGLRGAEVVDVAEASGVDTCLYDLVADDDFILGAGARVPDGASPGSAGAAPGTSSRPGSGRVLAQLAVQRRHGLRHRPLRARPVRRRQRQ